MKPLKRLTLYVCSTCNLSCQECIMQHHMKFDPHYQMSLNEVDKFLVTCIQSKYRFEITLSGGEPLLWKHINKGVALLRSSKVVQRLVMFTNAVPHLRMYEETGKLFDKIRISDYGHNRTEMERLKARFGKIVHETARYGFYRNPREAVPPEISHPVKCMNNEVMLYNNRVYACPHCLSIVQTTEANKTPEALSVPLAPNFLKHLDGLKQSYHNDICTRCISNKRIREYIGVRDINVSKGKKPGNFVQLQDFRQPAQDEWK